MKASAKALAVPLLRHPDAVAADARSLGRTVLGIALGLTSFGLVMIYSWTAVKLAHASTGLDPDRVLAKQASWAAIAGLVAFAAARVPLEWMRARAPLLLGILLVLLGLTLVPGIGKTVNRSRRWLEIGPVTMQASEFLKIAVIVYLADRLARREESAKEDRTPWPALLAPIAIGIVFIMAEPDLGTSLFVASIAVVMLGLAGVRPGRLLPYAALALPLLVVVACRALPPRQRAPRLVRPRGEGRPAAVERRRRHRLGRLGAARGSAPARRSSGASPRCRTTSSSP